MSGCGNPGAGGILTSTENSVLLTWASLALTFYGRAVKRVGHLVPGLRHLCVLEVQSQIRGKIRHELSFLLGEAEA